jgi:serine protease SohB
VRLTVCVDKVAASGGYMMACVADRLLAAPFATLGSIGATTSVPILNVEKLLTRFGVRAYAVRSGKHKGGGPVLVGDARADQEALAKLQEDLVRVVGYWGWGWDGGLRVTI